MSWPGAGGTWPDSVPPAAPGQTSRAEPGPDPLCSDTDYVESRDVTSELPAPPKGKVTVGLHGCDFIVFHITPSICKTLHRGGVFHYSIRIKRPNLYTWSRFCIG